LDCLGNNINGNGASNTYGVFLTGSNTKNNTIMNCSITNFYGGIFLYNGPNNNSFINNTIKSNTGYGILFTGSNSNIITGGSIFGNTLFDYYLNNAGATNQFINTNFTSNRTIRFLDATSWFNYNNLTTIQLWLNTSVSSAANITRKITSWNQSLMKWNDTNTSAPASTVTYNITGLKPNKDYAVFNNSILINTLHTDSSGNLPSFTVNLGSEHEIGVQEVRRWFDTNLTDPYSKIYTSSNPLTVYKNNEFNVIANATCRTDPPGLSGGCGSVSAGVRYNDSSTTMTLVSTTIGASPMWTSGKIETDQYIYNYWNFSVGGQNPVGGQNLTQPTGIAYNGTYFWITNKTNPTKVFRYKASDKSYDSSFSCTAQDSTSIDGIDVNNTRIFVVGSVNKNLYIYDTNGNWITTYSLASSGTNPVSIVTNNTYFWILTSATGNYYVWRYKADGTYDNWRFNYTVPTTSVLGDGLEFNGTHFFISDIFSTGGHVYCYNLTGNYTGLNFSTTEDPYGLAYDENQKNFYTVGYDDKYVRRYERNTTGAGNPISLGPMNDGDSNQVTFIVNATTPGDRSIDVNFTSDLGFENNTNDSYIRIKDAASEFLIINSTEIKPDPANPIEGGNATINITVNITNSTYMDPVNGCSVRIFNSSMSYSNPTIGPLQGTIRRVNTQWQCNRTWYMEYWRNSGQWNVSVDLKLWMGISNFTSKNFTYNSLYVWADNISTEIISWVGVPDRTVNSSNAYPMLLNNTGNEKLNISINGSNFIGGSLIIGVGNSSFSNTTQTGPYYNISKIPQLMVTLDVREIKYVYFRAYIPLGFSSQTYNNNLNVTTKY
jgi:parallel beta-helix repeat protein